MQKACDPPKSVLPLTLYSGMKPLRYILLFALLALFAVGCAKEEPVRPHTMDANGAVLLAKDRTGVVQDTSGDSTPQEGVNGCEPSDPDQGDPGISDDGDDISDSEKSRKKRR